MWVVCKATLGKGKNKLLIRGAEGTQWIFCPLIRGIKRDRVTIDRCQECKHFIRFQQTYTILTHTTRKHFSFGSRTLLKGAPCVVRPLGWLNSRNTAKPSASPWTIGAISEREPIVDILEEKDHLMIVAELPYINERDIDIKVEDNTLTITADDALKNYVKKIMLPTQVRKDKVKSTYRNSILEVRLEKACNKA